MASRSKIDVNALTEAQIDDLIERILAARPWRGPLYSAALFFRRWAITIHCSLSAFMLRPDISLVVIVGALGAFFDAKTRSLAIDVSLDDRSFVNRLFRGPDLPTFEQRSPAIERKSAVSSLIAVFGALSLSPLLLIDQRRLLRHTFMILPDDISENLLHLGIVALEMAFLTLLFLFVSMLLASSFVNFPHENYLRNRLSKGKWAPSLSFRGILISPYRFRIHAFLVYLLTAVLAGLFAWGFPSGPYWVEWNNPKNMYLVSLTIVLSQACLIPGTGLLAEAHWAFRGAAVAAWISKHGASTHV